MNKPYWKPGMFTIEYRSQGLPGGIVVPQNLLNENPEYFQETLIDGKPTITINTSLKNDYDARKLQSDRNLKLDRFRQLIQIKMVELDHMTNDYILGIRNDGQALQDYKVALKAMTDPYKANNNAIQEIDGLDFNNIDWPVKP